MHIDDTISSVISWQGAIDNGLEGLTHVLKLNLYPKNLAAASSWFGVTVSD